jgi:hypothetical protein
MADRERIERLSLGLAAGSGGIGGEGGGGS